MKSISSPSFIYSLYCINIMKWRVWIIWIIWIIPLIWSLFDLQRALISGWPCIPNCTIKSYGRYGKIEVLGRNLKNIFNCLQYWPIMILNQIKEWKTFLDSSYLSSYNMLLRNSFIEPFMRNTFLFHFVLFYFHIFVYKNAYNRM